MFLQSEVQMTYITPTWINKFHINPARRLCTHAGCLLCGGVMIMGGGVGCGMWWNSHNHQQRRTQSRSVKELLSSKWYICKKKEEKKTRKQCSSQEKCLFSEGVSRFLPLSFKDPYLAQAEHVGATPPWWVCWVKRRCLLFLKESESTQPLPATAVFLKCNLCLSFCRVLGLCRRILK